MKKIVLLIKTSVYQPPPECFPCSRHCQFESAIKRDKLLDLCYQRVEPLRPAIPKHEVTPLQAHLEARDKAQYGPFTVGDTTTLLLPTATAPLLNLISSN